MMINMIITELEPGITSAEQATHVIGKVCWQK